MGKIKRPKQVGSWWPCEESVLVSMLQEQYRLPFIAEVLNRDIRSIYAKIKVMSKHDNKLNIGKLTDERRYL